MADEDWTEEAQGLLRDVSATPEFEALTRLLAKFSGHETHVGVTCRMSLEGGGGGVGYLKATTVGPDCTAQLVLTFGEAYEEAQDASTH